MQEMNRNWAGENIHIRVGVEDGVRGARHPRHGEEHTERGREREGGTEGERERECGSARPARSVGSEIRLKRKQ